MPGAQPRRSPVERLASSVRRGAPVGPGTPGVSRVQRQGPQQAGSGGDGLVEITHGEPTGRPEGWLIFDLDDSC